MIRYFLFIFKSLLFKKSFYFSSLLYFLTLIMITYIFPLILQQNIMQLFMFWFIWTMLVLALAISITVISIFIFKNGIEDGTEILISSKPITRQEAILAKILLIFLVILFQSFVSFIIPLFLPLFAYGVQNQMLIALGYFCFCLVVGTLFAATGMLFSLITKNQIATFLNFSFAFFLLLSTTINNVLSTTPGQINKQNGFSLTNQIRVRTIDPKTKKLGYSEGYVLKYNNQIVEDLTKFQAYLGSNPETWIQQIWNNAYNKSTFTKTVMVDPVYQWISLLNLNNYSTNSKDTPYWYRDLSFLFTLSSPTVANMNFDTTTDHNFLNIKINNLESNSQNNKFIPVDSWIGYARNNKQEKIINVLINPILEQEFIILPQYDISPTTLEPDCASLKLYMFSKKEIFKNKVAMKNFFNFLFNENTVGGYYPEYLKTQQTLKKTNLSLFENYNYNNFIFSKINTAINIILNNIQKTPNNKLPFYYNNQEVTAFDKTTYNTVKNKIQELFFNFNFNIYNNLDYSSSSAATLLSLIKTFNFSYKNIFLDYFIYLQVTQPNKFTLDYNNPDNKKIIDYINNTKANPLEDNGNYFFLDSNDTLTLNKYMYEIYNFKFTNNNNNLDKYLNLVKLFDQFAQNYSIFKNYPFLKLENSKSLLTFKNIKIDLIINGPGVIFGWLSLSLIMMLCSCVVYARKDFK